MHLVCIWKFPVRNISLTEIFEMAYKVELQELTNGLVFLLCYGKKGYTQFVFIRHPQRSHDGTTFSRIPCRACVWLCVATAIGFHVTGQHFRGISTGACIWSCCCLGNFHCDRPYFQQGNINLKSYRMNTSEFGVRSDPINATPHVSFPAGTTIIHGVNLTLLPKGWSAHPSKGVAEWPESRGIWGGSHCKTNPTKSLYLSSEPSKLMCSIFTFAE